jgi:segregation and condensation protein B
MTQETQMFEVNDEQLKQIIKAILFVAGEGIELLEFTEKFGRTLNQVKQLVEQLKQELSGENGIHLITYGAKAQLSSNPNYAEAVASVLNPIREKALTKAAMQTLAIIAYKQPITRLEIEAIRGVSSDYAVQVLLENNMIEVVGRKDVVGKPLLFGTTEQFLKRFDLQSVEDLPDYEELLERIKLIRIENQNNSNLYRDHQISDEELPQYLEEQKTLTEEEIAAKKQQDEMLKQKFKDIESVIRQTKSAQKEAMSDQELQEIFSKVLASEPQQENKGLA